MVKRKKRARRRTFQRKLKALVLRSQRQRKPLVEPPRSLLDSV
jgi:hypothetical protein